MTAPKQELTPDQKAQYNIQCLIRIISAAKKDCLNWIYEEMDNAEERGELDKFPYRPQHAFQETFLSGLQGGAAETLKKFIGKRAVFVMSEAPIAFWLPPDLVFLIEEKYIEMLKAQFTQAMSDVHEEMREIVAEIEAEDEEPEGEEPEDEEPEDKAEGGSDGAPEKEKSE